MQSITPEQRSDPKFADTVIRSIFEGIDGGSKRSYLRFLASSIDTLSADHRDRWGASLFEWGIRLNAGQVETLISSRAGVRVLVDKKAAPSGTRFDRSKYKNAPGCGITTIRLAEIARVLPTLSQSHHKAILVAASRQPPESIREAHSEGITKLLSQLLDRTVPDPSYSTTTKLHLINGGYKNGDKIFLQRAAVSTRRAKSWVVPKGATVGDMVVINVAGLGFFATGRVASHTKPRTDWPNRYGAALESIELIEPPISLDEVQRHIPALKWARYPRSISTPSTELAEQIRDLVRSRVRAPGGETKLESASPEDIASFASMNLGRATTPRQRMTNQFIRSARVRKYVLKRANGFCEGCGGPAPFVDRHGSPFLETHHTKRISIGGQDHPWHVIALCPNCHRRTDSGSDATSFNASLTVRLAKLKSAASKA